MTTSVFRRFLSMASKNSANYAPLLISPSELQTLRSTSSNSFKILDTTWFMPNVARIARAEFNAKHIPSSQYWDLDEIASENSMGLKHMLPDASRFRQACEEYGISDTDHVVMYDTHGVFSSPRALFTFRTFGHMRSSVLDGGLPGWTASGLPVVAVEDHKPEASPRSVIVKAELEPLSDSITSYEQIVNNANKNPENSADYQLILDARPKGRWTGADPEPRPGLSSGHIPHSLSLPFSSLLQKHKVPGSELTYTTMLPVSELRVALQEALGENRLREVLEQKRSVVSTCGSGMSAAIIWLALQILEVPSSIYDESWTGYAQRSESKIDKVAM